MEQSKIIDTLETYQALLGVVTSVVKKVDEVTTNIVLVTHLDRKYLSKDSVHDVIQRQKITNLSGCRI